MAAKGGSLVLGQPPLIEVNDFPGIDYLEKWKKYLEHIYQVYLTSIAYGGLKFNGLPIKCQFRPETFGKHYAFWHMMQEGKIEDDRTIDLERCRRVSWISWVINNAHCDERIRVFPQERNGTQQSWVLWLYEENYAVILWERKQGYFLLKTAFIVKSYKYKEFERDWQKYKP